MSSKALPRSNCRLREHSNHEWRVIIEAGTPPERLQDSDFWSVVAGDFLAYDKLFCIAADRSWYAELLVLDAGKGYCRVEELIFKPLPALVISQEGLPPNFEIVHSGDDMYIVRRLSDSVIMGKGFTSRDEALAFLLDHATLR